MVKTRKSVKVTKNAKTKMKAGITAPKSGIVKEEEGLDDEQVSCWDDTLAAGSIPRLLQDAKTLWDLYGGGGSQSAKTFWIGRKKKTEMPTRGNRFTNSRISYGRRCFPWSGILDAVAWLR